MTFFDKKTEVMKVELTPLGRYKLSIGRLKPHHYRFFDNNVIYDGTSMGISEDQNDSDHRISFLRSINKIDGEKIKKSALSFRKYRMKNEMVSKIKIETLVIGASDDPLHDHKQIINISKTLPNCKFIDLISFSRSHSSKAAESILLFLQKVILETNE